MKGRRRKKDEDEGNEDAIMNLPAKNEKDAEKGREGSSNRS